MLPVTPYPLRGPGYWGSPFARPMTIDVGSAPRGVRIPKGVWMVKCGPNRVDIVWREDDDFDDEPRRVPGTGLVRPSRRDVPNPQFQQPQPRAAARTAPPAPQPAQRQSRWGPPGGPPPTNPPCPPPPCPPPGPPGDNRLRHAQLVREHSTGVVFADGHSVILSGWGHATAIRVFSV